MRGNVEAAAQLPRGKAPRGTSGAGARGGGVLPGWGLGDAGLVGKTANVGLLLILSAKGAAATIETQRPNPYSRRAIQRSPLVNTRLVATCVVVRRGRRGRVQVPRAAPRLPARHHGFLFLERHTDTKRKHWGRDGGGGAAGAAWGRVLPPRAPKCCYILALILFALLHDAVPDAL